MNKISKKWTPPDRLDRSRPREVQLTVDGYALLAVCIALIIGGLVGAVALTSQSQRQFEERQMLQTGSDVVATVTRLWRRGESNTPWVSYSFTFAGNSFSGEARTPLAMWRTLTVGGPISIRFAPENPPINAPRGGEGRVLPGWAGALLGTACAVGGALVALFIRKQRRLLSEGRAARGVVKKHAKGSHGTKVYYDFELLSGATAHGHGDSGKAKPAAIGAPICVLYDTENPRRNAVYPMSLVRLKNPV